MILEQLNIFVTIIIPGIILSLSIFGYIMYCAGTIYQKHKWNKIDRECDKTEYYQCDTIYGNKNFVVNFLIDLFKQKQYA